MKCKFCDKELIRKDYENDKRFAARKFCDPECVMNYQRKTGHWREYHQFRNVNKE